ncbi:MAG: hypothetical protein ACKPI8_26070 [Microcystis panniformis]
MAIFQLIFRYYTRKRWYIGGNGSRSQIIRASGAVKPRSKYDLGVTHG